MLHSDRSHFGQYGPNNKSQELEIIDILGLETVEEGGKYIYLTIICVAVITKNTNYIQSLLRCTDIHQRCQN